MDEGNHQGQVLTPGCGLGEDEGRDVGYSVIPGLMEVGGGEGGEKSERKKTRKKKGFLGNGLSLFFLFFSLFSFISCPPILLHLYSTPPLLHSSIGFP